MKRLVRNTRPCTRDVHVACPIRSDRTPTTAHRHQHTQHQHQHTPDTPHAFAHLTRSHRSCNYDRHTHRSLPHSVCTPLSALRSPLSALYSPYAPARCLMRQVPPIPTKRQLPHTITNCTLAPLRLRRSLCRTRRSRSRSLPCCLPRAHSPSRATLLSLAHASTDTLHTSQEPTPHGHFREPRPWE